MTVVDIGANPQRERERLNCTAYLDLGSTGAKFTRHKKTDLRNLNVSRFGIQTEVQLCLLTLFIRQK